MNISCKSFAGMRVGGRLISVAFFLLCSLFLFTSITVHAAPADADQSGDWNDPNTWKNGVVPPVDADVKIKPGITVTIPLGYAAACGKLELKKDGAPAILIFAGATSSLVVSGDIKIDKPRNGTSVINVGAGTLSAAKIDLKSPDANKAVELIVSTGTVNVTGDIIVESAGSKITFTDAGTLNAGGTFMSGRGAGTFTAGTGTVNFNRTGAQTISPYPYTFNNVTLSGSGVKTTTNATINGTLSMEGTATTGGTVATYGAAATLQYNGSGAQTTGTEFPATWTGSGGVIIVNTNAAVTLNQAKTINAPLTINTNANLNTNAGNNYALTFGDDFINDGTLSGNASQVTISGTETQNIGGFTTTGNVFMTKTGGEATLTGDVNANGLIIDGVGGTLDLGAGLTHTTSGSVTITNGTLDGGSSTLNIDGDFDGTGGVFTASTSSVVFQGTGTSTISGDNSFNNLSSTTPGKALEFQQGSKQTVDGQFTIDGGTTGTRVSLASAGGAGTTWNLELNGSYTCQYAAVQGTLVSGTVSLPINSIGSLDNGDNANWFHRKYFATYLGNGSDGGTAPVDGNSPYQDGVTVTVLGAGTLTKTGHTFTGWNTAANGTGTNYAAAATFTMGTADVKLYAQWWAAGPTYTVTYDGNTNDGGAVPVDESNPYVQSATVTVLGNTGSLSKTGYLFTGWNTADDGSGIDYAPAATFAMVTANVTLYAQWFDLFSISGTVYTDEAKTTPIAVGKKISLSVNGAAVTSTTTQAGGTFQFSLVTPPNANDILLIYLDGETEKASLVTKSDGVTDLSDGNALQLVVDKIILEHQTGTEITNTDLDIIDGVDAGDDDGISIAGGNATFANGFEVWVSAGSTYASGGNITLENIEVVGTLNLAGNTLNTTGSVTGAGGITPGTSTVNFLGVNPVTLSGNLTFNNFICTVPSKVFTVTTGSTITVNGLFRLEGDRASSTRITFASSGGAGTTWNLILNGKHDCNFVNSQGSNVSGTTYLPINPAGYFNSGNNTNWYDSALPEDVIFYDNFENSTLGSASPDRESSNWGLPGWCDGPGVTVNTQNHTSGGSQSMYSAGGPVGKGDASWNSPSWGPVDNGVAEVWFYDDMNDGVGKRIWAFVDSSDGTEWAAIGLSTVDSTTKYCYHLGVNDAVQPTQVTFIDRSVGWHKATWIRDENFITLYIDDIQVYQGANTQLDNFATFELGAWDFDNPNGSSAMWFDDCIVYRSQHQSKYRWYANDSAENSTPIDAEDTAITREINQPTRVRIQLQNDMAMDWGSNATYVGLQYRQGSNGTWVDLGASAHWEYVDGLGNDGSQVANALLTNTDNRNHFIESQPSTQILTAASTDYGEWDFSIQANSNASIGSDYFFRMVCTDAAGNYLKAFAAYPFLPECQVVSLSMWVWTGQKNNNWNDDRNWNQPTIPDATSDVIIQSGANRNPRVNISGALCKSLVIQTGRTLLLDTAGTDLTVSNNMTVSGTVTHSNNTAVLNLNGGELNIDGGTYNHTGNASINAANADMRILNLGVYNFNTQATVNFKDLYVDNTGTFSDGVADGTFNVVNFNVLGNGQFTGTRQGTNYNITGNFVNDGSMLGSTGGIFNFNGTGKTYSGNAVNHILYQANFNGSYTVNTTKDINFLDDVTIGGTGTLTAGTGTLNAAGNWTNSNSFVHGSGTVNFNGTGLQQVTSGSSSWFTLSQTNVSGAGVSFLDGFTATNLTNTTANSTMIFNAGNTYNITGALTLDGTAGNEVNLVSSTPGTKWKINPSGENWSVDYIDVADSFNIYEEPILPTNSINNGNSNINWFSGDRDGDEIPDYWEYGYYANLTNSPDSDTDVDGLTLLEEFTLDTDPTVTTNNTIYVNCKAGYIGDGSAGAPYKYLKDALDAANNGTLVSLAEGTYELDDYVLTKRVVIKGEKGAYKTIIRGATPDGSSSNTGQMLSISSKNFGLSDVTLMLFNDDKPIISYQAASKIRIMAVSNVIFKENNIATKSIIAPTGSSWPKKVYIYNCLFYDNSALSAFELSSIKEGKAFNNTIVDNTFGSAAIVSGNKNSWLTNNVLYNSGTEITDNSTATLTVSFCNIEGGYGASVDSYDAEEDFMDSINKFYRLMAASSAHESGTITPFNWDLDNKPRPDGAAFDVGCYEFQANDNDGDGLTNAYEIANGYNENHWDSDLDGITDGDEINTYATSPLNKNTDGDFIDDGDEPAMLMDPSVADGVGDIMGVYYTSFESDVMFPEGPLSDTIWGPNGNASSTLVIEGQMTIENVGAAAAYDGVKVGKAAGQTPESSFVGWVDRNFLDNYWVSISYKAPRAKLPTDINEAFNIAGCFFAFDENGFLNVYNATTKNWLKDTQVTPNDWSRITIHRNHPGKVVNVWVETRQAFANVPIVGPDPAAGTGKFRMSFSSVGEQDASFDLFSALPFAPF